MSKLAQAAVADGFDVDEKSGEVQRRLLARTVKGILNGSVNWTGELTLTADGATELTTEKDDNVTPDSQVSLIAMTPEAAALVGKVWLATLTPGTQWSGKQTGEFILKHPPLTAGVVARFRYSLKG